MSSYQQIAAMLVILAAQEAVRTNGRCIEPLRNALRIWDEAAATPEVPPDDVPSAE